MDHLDQYNTILEKITEQPVFDVNDVNGSIAATGLLQTV